MDVMGGKITNLKELH